MVLLLNALSLNMLNETECDISLSILPQDQAVGIILGVENLVSAVGHQSTADLLTSICGVKILADRRSVDLALLREAQVIIVAQYTGPRLQAGATELPPEAKITWWRVEVR